LSLWKIFTDPLHTPPVISTTRGHSGPMNIMKLDGFSDSRFNTVLGALSSNFDLPIVKDANCRYAPYYVDTPYLGENDRAVKMNGSSTNFPQRQTIYINYLKEEATKPLSNIVIKGSSLVSRILFDVGTPKKAIGVVYIQNGTEQTAYINENGRVILAASSSATPVILELSGIGNCTYLSLLGIDCLIDLKGVGENLIEQSYLNFLITVNTPNVSVDDSALFLGNFRSPIKPGPNNVPDTEIGGGFLSGFGVPAFFLGVVNLQPYYRGSIHAKYNDITRMPNVQLNFGTNGLDGDHFVWIFRTIRNFMTRLSATWSITDISATSGISNDIDNATLATLLAPYLVNEFHTAGTARFGQSTDPMAVCDQNDGKVFGTQNLYVVDASAHPFPARAHPNAQIRGIAGLLAKKHLGLVV